MIHRTPYSNRCFATFVAFSSGKGDRVFAKVSASADPVARARELRKGCPGELQHLAIAPMNTREDAFALARELRGPLSAWRGKRGWFALRIADKRNFANALKGVTNAWPARVTWIQMPLKRLIHQWDKAPAGKRFGGIQLAAVARKFA